MTRSPKKSQPLQETEKWAREVLDDIEVKAVPIQYIKEINIMFTNGDIMTIDVKKTMLAENFEEIEDYLEELIEEHEDNIEGVDFSLDTAKVHKDVTKQTKRFFKKKK